jgi:hypothetical protein
MPNKRFNKQVPAFKAGGRASKMGGGMMMKKPMMKKVLKVHQQQLTLREQNKQREKDND